MSYGEAYLILHEFNNQKMEQDTHSQSDLGWSSADLPITVGYFLSLHGVPYISFLLYFLVTALDFPTSKTESVQSHLEMYVH